MPAMNKPLLEVMQKRGALLARIAAQRKQMSGIGTRLRTPLAFADQGLSVLRFLRSNLVLVAGVTALVVIPRRGVIGLVKGVWRMWKVSRRFSGKTMVAALVVAHPITNSIFDYRC